MKPYLQIYSIHVVEYSLPVMTKLYEKWLMGQQANGYVLLAIHPKANINALKQETYIHIFATIKIEEKK